MLNFSSFIFLQIISESFPVSSSDHLLLLLTYAKSCNVALFTEFFSFLERSDVMFALHAPTVFIIALFYVPRFVPIISCLRTTIGVVRKSIGYVILANILTVACYVIIKKFSLSIPLWLGFCITFLLLISTRRPQEGSVPLGAYAFFVLGCVQGIAILPGISRFAAVYAAGYALGLSGRKAFDVAWMLQFALIMAAACLGWAQLVCSHETDLLLNTSALWAQLFGTVIGFFGLYTMYLLAKHARIWIMAGYIIIPLAISLWYGV